MEVSVELEDDLFFADLSKQISLLIMDDDDEEDPSTRYPSVSWQGFSRGDYPITAPPQLVAYGQSCKRDQSKGTGVFIPQSSAGRSKQRHGRFNSFNTKSSYRHQDYNNAKMVSQSHHAPGKA
ncbi:hypothetical protein SLEP1_g46456 [Rubroshorea leprosula]|uniref:Uncharacterized protein n=1 Tax=Rubroshorea leprosula TaxID=152421 RepID=A0AAV5LNW1_9ROSI|nr:hypothetical protein SLEP1_g46456 [Rubroshorea leprosula]